MCVIVGPSVRSCASVSSFFHNDSSQDFQDIAMTTAGNASNIFITDLGRQHEVDNSLLKEAPPTNRKLFGRHSQDSRCAALRLPSPPTLLDCLSCRSTR